jgi:hypothetical protein
MVTVICLRRVDATCEPYTARAEAVRRAVVHDHVASTVPVLLSILCATLWRGLLPLPGFAIPGWVTSRLLPGIATDYFPANRGVMIG